MFQKVTLDLWARFPNGEAEHQEAALTKTLKLETRQLSWESGCCADIMRGVASPFRQSHSGFQGLPQGLVHISCQMAGNQPVAADQKAML